MTPLCKALDHFEPALQLEEALRKTAAPSPWPGLADAAKRAKAIELARENGLFERLAKRLAVSAQDSADDDSSAPEPTVIADALAGVSSFANRYAAKPKAASIERLDWSVIREYHRAGKWSDLGILMNGLARCLDEALALWLDHPSADADRLEEILWVFCDFDVWMPQECVKLHPADLFATQCGATLSDLLVAVGDRLDPRVVQRVRQRVEERALAAALDWRNLPIWMCRRNNWNHVCFSNVMQSALCLMNEPRPLASLLVLCTHMMEFGMTAFSEEGGCTEGPGYWDYGFGHFLEAAVVLRHVSGGLLNLMDSESAQRIARYPLAVWLDGKDRCLFSDTASGYMNTTSALMINSFMPLPQLFDFCDKGSDGRPQLNTWRDLLLAVDSQAWLESAKRAPSPIEDAFLPSLGFAKVVTTLADGSRVQLAATALHNAASHNQNDLGSFVYYRDGRAWISDLGVPDYTAENFGPNRYDHILNGSQGHPVPVINGHLQQEGAQYRASLAVDPAAADGSKSLSIDLSRAYPDPTVVRFERRLTLNADGDLEIADDFEFSQSPSALLEVFTTYLPCEAVSDGVLIGGAEGMTLKSNQSGSFAVELHQVESRCAPEDKMLRRIVFTPSDLKGNMSLAFKLQKGNLSTKSR
ncbi:MAG: heparinase II/III family protein [Verrucomicrobiota bacterium]